MSSVKKIPKKKPSVLNLPRIEKEILQLWREKKVFEKSLSNRTRGKPFVFYEGPPSANAPMGVHHVLGRVYKDIICRYKTMCGYLVERKAGWDTHGLPIELAVERAIGVNSKKEIERYGVKRFNKKAKELVWKYKKSWDALTERIGFWLNLEDPYITYETSYIESLWWVMKQIWRDGRLYRDYKVVPYCTRCGTALSSHEVAQGYKSVSEDSVVVRFALRDEPNTYLLAWTTTPWTLPANVALAVHPDLTYSKLKLSDGSVGIVAQVLKERVAPGAREVGHLAGKLLAGKEYEPLYTFLTPDKPAYRVITASFVDAKGGTGVVHIAPAFGADDMEAGRANNLPVLFTADEEGKFVEKVTPWKRMFVKDADPLIIEDLTKRKKVYAVMPYTHEYPFCWRCSTPLIYFAKRSWFIRMQDLRTELLQENERIRWEPAHLKYGRFREWLGEVKDWTFSRERYWGTPLPIWICEQCGNEECIGSITELTARRPRLGNTYFLIRHGQARANKEKIISSYPEKFANSLTKKGIQDIQSLIPRLKRERIDYIVTSDLLRARETARILHAALGVPVITDPRLREWGLGRYNGKPNVMLDAFFKEPLERFTRRVPGGETWRDVRRRMVACVRDLERTYSRKKIVIVSHGDPLWMLTGALRGLAEREIADIRRNPYLKTGQMRVCTVPYAPFDETGEMNLHRPYVDDMVLRCTRPECGSPMRRVSDVVDVWFDSGAMPFAQWHYPFTQESRKRIDRGAFYPADYICEGIDQTRGWFYTLLAVSTLLGKERAYRNVISVGHVLDAKGEGMHKSKGNVLFPAEVINRHGVDAIRWFYFTVNAAGESKRFDEKEIVERARRFHFTLWNCLLFYTTYVTRPPRRTSGTTPLDKWMYARLYEATRLMRESLDRYDVPTAARALDGLVDDFSNWYLRRSRPLLQRPVSAQAANRAAWHLAAVLGEITKLAAPFVPFFSEALYQRVIPRRASVHLQEYPSRLSRARDHAVLKEMQEVRAVVALGLAVRKRANIKVRQPLGRLVVAGPLNHLHRYTPLIKDELNVKQVEFASRPLRAAKSFLHEKGEVGTVYLDTTLTAALREEGFVREWMRQIQDARKQIRLSPSETVSMKLIHISPETEAVFARWAKTIEAETRVRLGNTPLARRAYSFRLRGNGDEIRARIYRA